MPRRIPDTWTTLGPCRGLHCRSAGRLGLELRTQWRKTGKACRAGERKEGVSYFNIGSGPLSRCDARRNALNTNQKIPLGLAKRISRDGWVSTRCAACSLHRDEGPAEFTPVGSEMPV